MSIDVLATPGAMLLDTFIGEVRYKRLGYYLLPLSYQDHITS